MGYRKQNWVKVVTQRGSSRRLPCGFGAALWAAVVPCAALANGCGAASEIDGVSRSELAGKSGQGSTEVEGSAESEAAKRGAPSGGVGSPDASSDEASIGSEPHPTATSTSMTVPSGPTGPIAEDPGPVNPLPSATGATGPAVVVSEEMPHQDSSCSAVDEQTVLVPGSLRGAAGSWEVRRIYDAPSDQVPTIESGEEAESEALPDALEIPTAGSDLQVVLFRDALGNVVDGQWHQTRCPGARPPRTGTVLEVPSDFETIQSAIDAASEGDTVHVAPGTYTETLRLRPGITLLGSGPEQTILDGQEQVAKLVDATGAYGASLLGFRLRGVAPGGSCAAADDPLRCSGEHYPAALYADGHVVGDASCCHASTFFAAGNVFESNAYGVMAYHRTHAILMDNVFEGNGGAVVVNFAADAFAVLESNVFGADNTLDIAQSAARVFAFHNAFENELTCATEFIQRGRFHCNSFTGGVTCDLAGQGSSAMIDFGEATAAQSAIDAGCVDATDPDLVHWFDFAGETGRRWAERATEK